ncbi:hypothetical protein ACHHYP_01206 [Achlya hypogyna]|uniref:Uncharacterized protein n=1 Tax=Achlya hypogyna TaxID=1202772 RepID=A0A1V9ZTM4_ACHHY|nr:hypothetical protein ACHHYP_01206 [Achlya hypogyna]
MAEPACFWNTSRQCDQLDWPTCGYGWLIEAPIGLIALVWLVLGAVMLRCAAVRIFELDVTKIHDPLAQGIVLVFIGSRLNIATSRRMKLLGMWAEWPAYTFAPLPVAFRAAGIQDAVEHAVQVASPVTDVLMLSFVAFGVVSVAVMRRWKSHHSHGLIEHFLCPLFLDVLYIPIVSTFLRLSTCPRGFYHIPLPDGATCNCIDRFGIFWSAGLLGFVAIYVSSIYYKMYIEPLSTTMDFRFQTGYDVVMVMARTLDPIISILVVEISAHKGPAMAIAVCLLLSMVALFVYSYKTQPCIGSGRTPNNIRALTFSSTIYTNICVVVFLFDPAPHDGLYYSLLPLPLVWLAAWRLNDRRAALVHIPDLPIVDLLHEPSTSANVVGAIAALYVDAAKVRPNEHEAIVSQLAKFARSGSMEDPLSRIYAIRTLWYCHIENFRKSKRFIGEQADDAALSHKLWLKDRMNPDRPPSHLAHQRGSRNQTRTSEEKRIKIFRVEDIHGMLLNTVYLCHVEWQLLLTTVTAPFYESRTLRGYWALSMPRPELTEYHVIQIRGKNWISKVETPEAAVAHFERLYQYSLEVLSQSRAAADPVAMREMALFLLQGYKARYLRFSKPVFLEVLTTLCVAGGDKLAIDAVHSLYSANLDGLIPAILWLRQSSLVNQLAAALGHPSASTVTKCALTLASILEKAEGVVNIYVLLTPETMSALHRAFHRWNRLYRVSDALERLYLALHAIEKQHFQHTLQNRAKKASIQVLSMIAATGARVRRSIVAVMAGPIGSLSTEVAKRKSWLVSAPIPSSRVAADIRSRRGHFNPSVTSPRAEATIDTPYDRGKCHLNPGNSRDSRVDAQAAFYSIHEASRAPFDATSSPRNSPFLTATDAAEPKSSTNDKFKFALVPTEVVAEIDRRRHLRVAFEHLLQEAFAIQGSSVKDPRSSLLDAPAEVLVQHQGHRVNVTSSLVELYHTSEHCALEDYISTVLDPKLGAYFNTQVKPCLHVLEPSAKRRRQFLRWLHR